MKPLITIIIPVFNEKENIERAVVNTKKMVKYSYEILVIYDFAQDNTLPVVKKLQKKEKNIKLILNKKGGLINAIKNGIKKAEGKAVVILSPDEADDPNTINKMYKRIEEGFDIVCATRYSNNGKRLEQQSVKMYLSKIAGFSTPLILGIPTKDITNGFKMFRKTILDSIGITSTGGWEFSMELTIKAYNKGYKITEVGTVSKNRKFGKTKFKLLKWLPKYIYWYLYAASNNLRKHAGIG